MDKHTSPRKGSTIPGPTIEDSIRDLIQILGTFPNLEKASMYLPYTFMDTQFVQRGSATLRMPFGKIGIGRDTLDDLFEIEIEGQPKNTKKTKNKVKEKGGLPTLISTDSLKTISELRDRQTRPTVLEVGRSKGRRYSRIIQRFPARVCDGKVRRRSGFYYWWNNKEVLISKTLGTTKHKAVTQQTELLLRECSRFYLVYCDTYNTKSR